MIAWDRQTTEAPSLKPSPVCLRTFHAEHVVGSLSRTWLLGFPVALGEEAAASDSGDVEPIVGGRRLR